MTALRRLAEMPNVTVKDQVFGHDEKFIFQVMGENESCIIGETKRKEMGEVTKS